MYIVNFGGFKKKKKFMQHVYLSVFVNFEHKIKEKENVCISCLDHKKSNKT